MPRPKEPDVGFFLGTVRPDGRPHAAGIGAVWHDGDLYFTSGPGTRKARNLASNPACTISVELPGMDLTLEGDAGPPPWHLYRFTFGTVIGLSTSEPNRATRWRFDA
jgi:hypothetical protein